MLRAFRQLMMKMKGCSLESPAQCTRPLAEVVEVPDDAPGPRASIYVGGVRPPKARQANPHRKEAGTENTERNAKRAKILMACAKLELFKTAKLVRRIGEYSEKVDNDPDMIHLPVLVDLLQQAGDGLRTSAGLLREAYTLTKGTTR